MSINQLCQIIGGVPKLRIVDIGAAEIEGIELDYADLVRAGQAEVIGFEPDSAACDNLNKKYGPTHKFLPYFVGDGRSATFYETNWGPTGSLYKPNVMLLELFTNLAELVRPVAEHLVSTCRLDDLPEVGDVDYIKIDIQGGELDALKASPRTLGGAVLVQTEVEFLPLYERQPLFGDIDVLMRKAGFNLHFFAGLHTRCFKPFVIPQQPHSGMRQVMWTDVVYVRDILRLAEIPTEKLAKLALLLHVLFASFDLCHLVLETLDRREGGDRAAQYRDFLVKTVMSR